MTKVNVMDKQIQVDQRYKWIGPDQRTGTCREHIVWVAFPPVDGMVDVQDEVGYLIPVAVDELLPVE